MSYNTDLADTVVIAAQKVIERVFDCWGREDALAYFGTHEDQITLNELIDAINMYKQNVTEEDACKCEKTVISKSHPVCRCCDKLVGSEL